MNILPNFMPQGLRLVESTTPRASQWICINFVDGCRLRVKSLIIAHQQCWSVIGLVEIRKTQNRFNGYLKRCRLQLQEPAEGSVWRPVCSSTDNRRHFCGCIQLTIWQIWFYWVGWNTIWLWVVTPSCVRAGRRKNIWGEGGDAPSPKGVSCETKKVTNMMKLGSIFLVYSDPAVHVSFEESCWVNCYFLHNPQWWALKHLVVGLPICLHVVIFLPG